MHSNLFNLIYTLSCNCKRLLLLRGGAAGPAASTLSVYNARCSTLIVRAAAAIAIVPLLLHTSARLVALHAQRHTK
jgi:hypothetical protein